MSLAILGWSFTAGVLLHNLEETIYLPAWTAEVKIWPRPIRKREFIFVVAVLSALMLLVTVLGTASKAEAFSAYLMTGYVLAVLLNVFLPHVLMTVLARSYMPGTATALLFNLPLGCLFLFRAILEHYVELRVFCWAAPLIAFAMLSLLPALFWVGRRWTRHSAIL